MEDSKVTTILMVRHADVHNPRQVVYGRLPRFRLSRAGIAQAGQLADDLANLPVAAIYSSPQLRARQTARIIAPALRCDRVRISTLIAEVLTGYQGQSNTTKLNFYKSPLNSSDETIAIIASRMQRFLDMTSRHHHGRIVVGVSHADPIMALRATTLGLPLVIGSLQGKDYPEKCSITQFSFVDGSRRPIVVYHPPGKAETPDPQAPPSQPQDGS